MKIICRAELLTAQRGSVWFSLLFRSHLTVIFTCNEISSGVFSLAARCGESFTLVNFYHPCHSLLLPVSHSLSTLCLTSCCSPFVYFSLCNNLHHLPVSNFPFPLPFATHLLSLLCPPFFTSSLPLPLYLCIFFPWFSSIITHLPLVFRFVYVVLSGLFFCGNQWICPYTCKCVVKNHSLQLFRPSGAQQIYTYMSAHSEAVTLFLPLSLCLAAHSHYFFSVLHFMFLSCHGQNNAFCGGFEILYTQMFWHYFKMSAQLCRCAYKWLVLCYLSVKKYGFQLKQKGLHKKAHTKNSAARPKMLFRAKHEQALSEPWPPGFPEV